MSDLLQLNAYELPPPLLLNQDQRLEERRLHCHGRGFDVVERPFIRSDETTTLSTRMNIGLHPVITNPRLFCTVCDNFLIAADGSVERLHRTPRTLVEI